jgi:hypothetical protein
MEDTEEGKDPDGVENANPKRARRTLDGYTMEHTDYMRCCTVQPFLLASDGTMFQLGDEIEMVSSYSATLS